jgi:hypothetical protein
VAEDYDAVTGWWTSWNLKLNGELSHQVLFDYKPVGLLNTVSLCRGEQTAAIWEHHFAPARTTLASVNAQLGTSGPLHRFTSLPTAHLAVAQIEH